MTHNVELSLKHTSTQVYPPRFHKRVITQSTASPGALNTMTLIVRSNFQVKPGEVVTITGLLGSK
jgi:hypothetical protein